MIQELHIIIWSVSSVSQVEELDEDGGRGVARERAGRDNVTAERTMTGWEDVQRQELGCRSATSSTGRRVYVCCYYYSVSMYLQ